MSDSGNWRVTRFTAGAANADTVRVKTASAEVVSFMARYMGAKVRGRTNGDLGKI